MNVYTFLVFGILTGSILSLWLEPRARERLSLGLWNILFAGSVVSGLLFGFLQPIALAPIVCLGMAGYRAEQVAIGKSQRIMAGLVVILLSIGLSAHILPGFSNPKIVSNMVFSLDTIPYTKYLNFDKALIGLFILAFGPDLLSGKKEWGRMLVTAAPIVMGTIITVMGLSLLVGYIKLDLKFSPVFPVWAWSNLFFTCVPEEGFFRGFLQKHLGNKLQKFKYGKGVTLIVISLLFGSAHFAGGIKYVILATIAGFGYGWVYYRTKSIEASILAHFSVNVAHFLLFSYPALV